MTQEQFEKFIDGILLGFMDIANGRKYLLKKYPNWVTKYNEIF